MHYRCRHTLTNGLVHAMHMPEDRWWKASQKEGSKERERERERGIYIDLIETKLPKPSPSSPPKFAPFRVLSWMTKSNWLSILWHFNECEVEARESGYIHCLNDWTITLNTLPRLSTRVTSTRNPARKNRVAQCSI